MRKLLVIVMVLIMLFILVGCGQEKAKAPSELPAAAATVNVPSVWVINSDLMDSAVYRIDPATNKPIAKKNSKCIHFVLTFRMKRHTRQMRRCAGSQALLGRYGHRKKYSANGKVDLNNSKLL